MEQTNASPDGRRATLWSLLALLLLLSLIPLLGGHAEDDLEQALADGAKQTVSGGLACWGERPCGGAAIAPAAGTNRFAGWRGTARPHGGAGSALVDTRSPALAFALDDDSAHRSRTPAFTGADTDLSGGGGALPLFHGGDGGGGAAPSFASVTTSGGGGGGAVLFALADDDDDDDTITHIVEVPGVPGDTRDGGDDGDPGAPIPEPGAALLFGLGFASVLASRRTRS